MIVNIFLQVLIFMMTVQHIKADCVVPSVEHGGWVTEDGSPAGETAPPGGSLQPRCDDGYSLIHGPASTLICRGVAWSDETYVSCHPDTCELPYLRDGQYLGGFLVGDFVEHAEEVRFQCDYRFKANSRDLRCNAGKLTPREPLCIPPEKCQFPVISNAEVTVESGDREHTNFVNNGTILVVRCYEGYRLKGSNTMRCHEGTMMREGDLPFCNPEPCTVPHLNNAEILDGDEPLKPGSEISHDAQLTFRCTEPNYRPVLKENQDLSCNYGILSFSPKCEPVTSPTNQRNIPRELPSEQENSKGANTGEPPVFPLSQLSIIIISALGAFVLILIVIIIACYHIRRTGSAQLPPSSDIYQAQYAPSYYNDGTSGKVIFRAISEDNKSVSNIYECIPDIPDDGYMCPVTKQNDYIMPIGSDPVERRASSEYNNLLYNPQLKPPKGGSNYIDMNGRRK